MVHEAVCGEWGYKVQWKAPKSEVLESSWSLLFLYGHHLEPSLCHLSSLGLYSGLLAVSYPPTLNKTARVTMLSGPGTLRRVTEEKLMKALFAKKPTRDGPAHGATRTPQELGCGRGHGIGAVPSEDTAPTKEMNTLPLLSSCTLMSFCCHQRLNSTGSRRRRSTPDQVKGRFRTT